MRIQYAQLTAAKASNKEREPDGDGLDLSYPENGPRVLVGTSCEDDEDSDPAEPALGSLDGQPNQTRWAAGGRRGLEVDPAESGIADLDGLLGQIGADDWQAGRVGMI